VFFVHCQDCAQTVRSIAAAIATSLDVAIDPVVSTFHVAHARCRLRHFFPTGRAIANGPWHEPMTERRIEVSGGDGLAVAVGTRETLQDELSWRIEPGHIDEELHVQLDHLAFWDCVDRALFPHHIPRRTLAAWATHVDDFVRRVLREDLVLLEDDPAHPSASTACLTLTSRVQLETSVGTFGFDPESERRLLAAFEDPAFPALTVTRRFVSASA